MSQEKLRSGVVQDIVMLLSWEALWGGACCFLCLFASLIFVILYEIVSQEKPRCSAGNSDAAFIGGSLGRSLPFDLMRNKE